MSHGKPGAVPEGGKQLLLPGEHLVPNRHSSQGAQWYFEKYLTSVKEGREKKKADLWVIVELN